MDKLNEELVKRIKDIAWGRYPNHNNDKEARLSFIKDLAAGATMANTVFESTLSEQKERIAELERELKDEKFKSQLAYDIGFSAGRKDQIENPL